MKTLNNHLKLETEHQWLVREIARVGYGSLTVRATDGRPIPSKRPKARYTRKPGGKYRSVSSEQPETFSLDDKTCELLRDVADLPPGLWEIEITISDASPVKWDLEPLE